MAHFIRLCVLGLFLGQTVHAQSTFFTLEIDNDLLFITDYYYSSGIFLRSGKELPSAEEGALSRYRVVELGQEIYTPSDRFSTDVREYDYPYGGWTYVAYTHQQQRSAHSQIEYGLQLGITGDESLARWMQNTYHTTALGLPENAWVDQVPTAFHFNAYARYYRQYPLSEYFSVNTQWASKVGTQRIDVSSRVGLAIGGSNILGLGTNPLFKVKPGDGFYLGVRTGYIFHDYMLSGSLFNEQAPFTAAIVPFRIEVESGLTYTTPRWKLLLLYRNRSRDNELQEKKAHHLMTLGITRFFD